MPTPRQAQPHELEDLRQLAHAFYLEDGFSTPPEQLRANLVDLLADDRRASRSLTTTAGGCSASPSPPQASV